MSIRVVSQWDSTLVLCSPLSLALLKLEESVLKAGKLLWALSVLEDEVFARTSLIQSSLCEWSIKLPAFTVPMSIEKVESLDYKDLSVSGRCLFSDISDLGCSSTFLWSLIGSNNFNKTAQRVISAKTIIANAAILALAVV